ncbi:MAG: hypothetical protein QOI98_1640, partial [Solirubrobacteraceae bacterium]|nr:hypothetical protein [Solirubrobacteraceae bacterium]
MSSPASRVVSRFGVPRLRVLLVAVVASLGSLALASPAFAGDAVPGGKVCPPAAESDGCGLGSSFDPNTTNIPYLGVAGEQIRLVKCGVFPDDAVGEWLPQPVDWSGDGFHQPQLVQSSVQQIDSEGAASCFAAEYISDKPGLAFIKLKIFEGDEAAGTTGPEITEHQFLAGWTRICGNTLTEVASPELGDPTGNGV